MSSQLTAPPGTPSGTMLRYEQGTNNRLDGYDIGIMNIYETEPGILVAQIAIHDPVTSKSEQVYLRHNEIVPLADKRYRVVQIVSGQDGVRGVITLTPVTP